MLYLQPEPLLQNPGFIRAQATVVHPMPAYSYARNNPVAFVDRTGLFSWRSACPDHPILGKRGFVIEKTDSFGIKFKTNHGAVGFDNQFRTACEDLEWMDKFEAAAEGLGPACNEYRLRIWREV